MGTFRTGIIALAFACFATPALAGAQGGYGTEPTREQWVAQAEGACKDATPRFKQLVRKVNRAAKGKPVKYGHAVVRLAKFLLDLRDELSALARPPADEDLIARWLAVAIRADKSALRSGKAYVRGNVGRGRAAFKKAQKLSGKAERIGRPFDFEYC